MVKGMETGWVEHINRVKFVWSRDIYIFLVDKTAEYKIFIMYFFKINTYSPKSMCNFIFSLNSPIKGCFWLNSSVDFIFFFSKLIQLWIARVTENQFITCSEIQTNSCIRKLFKEVVNALICCIARFILTQSHPSIPFPQ